MRFWNKFAALASVAALALAPVAAQAQAIGGTQGQVFADFITITNSTGTTITAQATAGGTYGMEVEGVTCLNVSLAAPLTPYPASGAAVPVNLYLLHNGTSNFVTKLVPTSLTIGTFAPLTNMLLTTGSYAPFADLPTDANDGHQYFPVAPGDKLELQVQATITGGYQLNCTVWGKTFN